jgi:hypothetical protein
MPAEGIADAAAPAQQPDPTRRGIRPRRPGARDDVRLRPTVYNYVHIGNARPPVAFGLLARLLRRLYPQVVYARNITDVDDKINAAAKEAGVQIDAITGRYAKAYFEDMARLGADAADLTPHATQHIAQIVAMCERLIASGHAYAAEGHVLFDVASYAEYGALSGRSVEDMIAGARVEVAPYKKNPADFVLWKPSSDDLPGWDSPWGRGRPGWHIECSAMAEAHLGETIDIHAGGNDLMFPHHENEIAQSTCAHGGKVFARYWLHNGMLTFDGRKMSKSLGNVLVLHDCSTGIRAKCCASCCCARTIVSHSTGLTARLRRRARRSTAGTRSCAISPTSKSPHTSASCPPKSKPRSATTSTRRKPSPSSRDSLPPRAPRRHRKPNAPPRPICSVPRTCSASCNTIRKRGSSKPSAPTRSTKSKCNARSTRVSPRKGARLRRRRPHPRRTARARHRHRRHRARPALESGEIW